MPIKPVSGEIKSQVLNDNFSALDTRIETVLAAGTVPDGEVADIRIGADQKVYTSAGQSVRSQINYLSDLLTDGASEMPTVNSLSSDVWTSKLGDSSTWWIEGYLRKPCHLKKIKMLFSEDTTASEPGILILDQDLKILNVFYYKSIPVNGIFEIEMNVDVSTEFYIAVRGKGLRWATLHTPVALDSMQFQGTFNVGDTITANWSKQAYSFAVETISIPQKNAEFELTSKKVDGGMTFNTILPGAGTSDDYASNFWITDVKYPKGFINAVSVFLKPDAIVPQKVKISIADAETSVVLDEFKTVATVAGEVIVPIKKAYDKDILIGINASNFKYRNDARSRGTKYTNTSKVVGQILDGWKDFVTRLDFYIDVHYGGITNTVGYQPIERRKRRFLDMADAMISWYNGEKFPIGFAGDSTDDGVGTTGWTGNVIGTDHVAKALNAYPKKLEEMLQTECNNTNLRVYNMGFSGKSMSWFYENVEEIIYQNPAYQDVKMVFLNYGINDPNHNKNDYTRFKGETIKVIESLYAHGIQPVLMTRQANIEQKVRFGWHAVTFADKAKKELAKEYDLEIVDLNKFTRYFNTHADASLKNIIRDMCHYNDLGHIYKAGVLFSHLIPRTIFTGDANINIQFSDEYVRSNLNYGDYVPEEEIELVYLDEKYKGFNIKVLWNYTEKVKMMDAQIFINGDARNLSSIAGSAGTYEIYIDGVKTDQTVAELELGRLELGLHRIEVYGTGDLDYYGLRLEV